VIRVVVTLVDKPPYSLRAQGTRLTIACPPAISTLVVLPVFSRLKRFLGEAVSVEVSVHDGSSHDMPHGFGPRMGWRQSRRLSDGRLVGGVPDQHLPRLSFRDSVRYTLVDGPEIDPSTPPRLPLEGQATYVGQAGGLYEYAPGSDWRENQGVYVIDEYEGTITIAADFADATLSACIGSTGDLVTRRAHFGIFLGDEPRDAQAIASGFELHFGDTPFNPDGTFERTDVTVRHPERTVVRSEGHWGGSLSNLPDRSGNPRLAAGFSAADFEESDGSAGRFFGTFVALSEALRGAGM